MSDPWKVVSERPIPIGKETTPEERFAADIAGLQREIRNAQESKTLNPEAKAHQIQILENELIRLINQQKPEGVTMPGITGQAAPPVPGTQFGFSPEQDVITGLTGAGIAVAPRLAGALGSRVMRGAGQAFGEGFQRGAGPLPTGAAPATPATPRYGGEKWVKSLTDVALPGGQMGKADLDLAKGMQAAVGREGVPGFTGGKITEGGILIGPQTAAQLPEAAPPAPAQPGPLRRAAGAIAGSPILQRGLGGFGAGAGAAETVERARAGDIPGAVLSGAGALGSLASMTGIPPIAGPGAALSVAAPAALGLADAVRNRMAQDAAQPQPEPTPEELERAALPAAGYYPRVARRRSPEEINSSLMEALSQQMKAFSSSP